MVNRLIDWFLMMTYCWGFSVNVFLTEGPPGQFNYISRILECFKKINNLKQNKLTESSFEMVVLQDYSVVQRAVAAKAGS